MRPDMAQRRRYVEMFHREAELTMDFRHPGVVEVFDCLQDREGRLFLMMELVEGVSLAELASCAEGDPREPGERLSFDMLRVIAVELLDALARVHRGGVIHRDISPSNVMVSGRGCRFTTHRAVRTPGRGCLLAPARRGPLLI